MAREGRVSREKQCRNTAHISGGAGGSVHISVFSAGQSTVNTDTGSGHVYAVAEGGNLRKFSFIIGSRYRQYVVKVVAGWICHKFVGTASVISGSTNEQDIRIGGDSVVQCGIVPRSGKTAVDDADAVVFRIFYRFNDIRSVTAGMFKRFQRHNFNIRRNSLYRAVCGKNAGYMRSVLVGFGKVKNTVVIVYKVPAVNVVRISVCIIVKSVIVFIRIYPYTVKQIGMCNVDSGINNGNGYFLGTFRYLPSLRKIHIKAAFPGTFVYGLTVVLNYPLLRIADRLGGGQFIVRLCVKNAFFTV